MDQGQDLYCLLPVACPGMCCIRPFTGEMELLKLKLTNIHADRKLPKCPGTALKRDVRQNWISIANLGKFGSVSF